MRRFIIIACMLFVICLCAGIGLADESEEAKLISLESVGFEALEKDKWSNPLYEQLTLEGYDHTVLAFSGENGKTEFRLYGKIEKKSGLFPASVTAIENEEGDVSFEVALLSTEVVKDYARDAGVLTIAEPPEEIPEGLTLNKKNMLEMTNLFGKKEVYAYGTYDNENFGYYKVESNKVVAGSLAYDLSNASAWAKPENMKIMSTPKEFKNGFQRTVEILTTDGKRVLVNTIYPNLAASLEVSMYLAGESTDTSGAPSDSSRSNNIPMPETGDNPVIGDAPASK